jgi:hypothetical protein
MALQAEQMKGLQTPCLLQISILALHRPSNLAMIDGSMHHYPVDPHTTSPAAHSSFLRNLLHSRPSRAPILGGREGGGCAVAARIVPLSLCGSKKDETGLKLEIPRTAECAPRLFPPSPLTFPQISPFGLATGRAEKKAGSHKGKTPDHVPHALTAQVCLDG